MAQPDFKTKAGPGFVARAGLFRATCEQRLLLLQQRQDSANGDGGTRENEEVKGDFHGKEAIALVIDLTLPGKDEAKKDHGDNNASIAPGLPFTRRETTSAMAGITRNRMFAGSPSMLIP